DDDVAFVLYEYREFTIRLIDRRDAGIGDVLKPDIVHPTRQRPRLALRPYRQEAVRRWVAETLAEGVDSDVHRKRCRNGSGIRDARSTALAGPGIAREIAGRRGGNRRRSPGLTRIDDAARTDRRVNEIIRRVAQVFRRRGARVARNAVYRDERVGATYRSRI